MDAKTLDAKIVEATEEHADFLAWVILEAHRSHMERSMWDIMFEGAPEEEILTYLRALTLSSQPHWTHHSIFIIAEVDGRPAAALSGYTEETHGTPKLIEATAEANRVVGRTEEEAMQGWERAGSIGLVAPEHKPDTWIVENVATLPEFRRRGLIDKLLLEILERGFKKGATKSDVSVFIGNDGAQAAYEKAGFKVVGEKLHPDFEAVYKCTGTRTLTRSI